MHFVLDKLHGVDPAAMRTTIDVSWDLAPSALHTRPFSVEQGQVMAITTVYKAFVNDENLGTITECYFMGPQACPLPDIIGDITHIAEVEGDPVSYRMRFDIGGSLKPFQVYPDDPPTPTARQAPRAVSWSASAVSTFSRRGSFRNDNRRVPK